MAVTYNTSPVTTSASLLTYTSPSPKLTLQSNGLYSYQAHNLYLNSAAPANQSVAVVSGATYAITITGSVSMVASGAATGTWTAGTTTFTAATATLTLASTTGSGTVHLRRTPSSSTYIATTSAARYNLPYEWNTSGTPLGIRVEPASTNLLLRSGELNTTWTTAGCSVTPNDAVAPNGLTQYDKIVEDSSTGLHRITQTFTATAAAYTYSFYVKAAERTRVALDLFRSGVAAYQMVFDLSAGATAGTTSGFNAPTSATITNVGNGSYRIDITATLTAAVWNAYVELSNGGTTVSYAGNGTSGLYAWGGMVELGTVATSPIETFGSTVTRAADQISLLLSAIPALGAEYTIVATGQRTSPAAATAYIAALDNGSTSELAGLRTASGTAAAQGFVQDGGALQAAISAGTWVADTQARLAMRVRANDFAASFNGGAVVADTSGTVPTPTTLSIGWVSAVGSYWSGHIASVVVVPRAVSNADLPTFGA